MKSMLGLSATFAILVSAVAANAAGIESGVQVGERVKAYATTQVCGPIAKNDGKTFCYT